MEEKVRSSLEDFIQDLLDRNYTTYFAATHPRYANSSPAFRFTPSPVSMAIPHCWSYQEARRNLLDISKLLTPEQAERRNINFVNPALKGFFPGATLPTLRGGIQMLLPHEKAYTHRHSANAFRLILEAPDTGAYTTVEGTSIPMRKGDLILTPNWTWHDHNNVSNQNVIWYDGLDVIMAFWIGGTFYEELREVSHRRFQPVHNDVQHVTSRHGAGLVNRNRIFPDHVPDTNNPLLYYPYSVARRQLNELTEQGGWDPYEGVILDYVNPVGGGPTFPSMSNSLRMINRGETVKPKRRTENIIYIVLEGKVAFRLPGGEVFNAGSHDVIAIPSWIHYQIDNVAQGPAVLFSQSDRPLFKALGFYREQLGET